MQEEKSNGYEFSICSLGVFGCSPECCDSGCVMAPPFGSSGGEAYHREQVLSATLEVLQGGFPESFIVEHVYPDANPPSNFEPNLRQKAGEELDFVHLQELNDGKTLVTI